MFAKYFDNNKSSSLANRFRRKRFRLFKEMLADIPRPVKVLDAGGTEIFWKMMEFTDPALIDVTIINTEAIETTLPNFRFIKNDVRDMKIFGDKQFDIVFSNSVIEHVGNYNNQKQMADEIERVGKKYLVQTPNYYFPFEPHFMFPFFQFLPLKAKILLLKYFNMGWFKKTGSNNKSIEILNSINLLTQKDLKFLFPMGKIKKEKFLFFTKSYIIVK